LERIYFVSSIDILHRLTSTSNSNQVFFIMVVVSNINVPKPYKKLVLVGDGGVGKTALTNRLRLGTFVEGYVPTLGVEVHPVEHDNTMISIWDTAGQERFSGLGDGYYLNADNVLVVYDVNSARSWASVPGWIDKVKGVLPNVTITLCGNKVDVGSRAVATIVVRTYAEAHGYEHFDVSAKSCFNFQRVVSHVH
jgi:GTP-binding nuclear protein Ran